MRFLITNDDGVHGPGIAALAESAGHLGDAIIVAPDEHLSGCSHRVTTDQPIRVHKRSPERWGQAAAKPS